MLLAAAIGIEAGYPWVLKVPAQWLAIAALPALIALVKVGIIDEVNFGGVKFKPLKHLGTFPSNAQLQSERRTIGEALQTLRLRGGGVEIKSESEMPGWTASKNLVDQYRSTHYLELVHVYKPAKIGDRSAYDISIYIMKHIPGWGNDNQTTGFTEIERAEFFFGPSWGNRIFIAQNQGETIGVNTRAWGQFLAACRVIFKAGDPIVLYRYIDFEMGRALQRK